MYFKFLNKPPTNAARWMTCVGRYFSKMAFVASNERRSPSVLRKNTQLSPATGFAAAYDSTAFPTRPEPPVTIITSADGAAGADIVKAVGNWVSFRVIVRILVRACGVPKRFFAICAMISGLLLVILHQ